MNYRPTVFDAEHRVMDGGLSADESRFIKRRFMLLDYFSDVGDVDTGSGDINIGPPLAIYSTPEPSIDNSYASDLLPYGVTAGSNPSLGSTPSTLSSTGGAALNTVSANPTVYSTGSQSQTTSLIGLSNSIAQWGFSIAGALNGSSSAQPQTRVITVGSSASSTNKNLMLFGFLVLAVIAVVIVVEE